MGQIFGKEKPLSEVMRENKRMITRAVRELIGRNWHSNAKKKRLTIEIKKAAKEGQMSSVKIMAKVCVCVCVSQQCLRRKDRIGTVGATNSLQLTFFFLVWR
jgi:hypothetical protein